MEASDCLPAQRSCHRVYVWRVSWPGARQPPWPRPANPPRRLGVAACASVHPANDPSGERANRSPEEPNMYLLVEHQPCS